VSVVFTAFGAIFGAVAAIVFAQEILGLTGPVVWTLGLPAAVIGYLVWDYSPLPNSNGGPMNIDPNTGWGWSDER